MMVRILTQDHFSQGIKVGETISYVYLPYRDMRYCSYQRIDKALYKERSIRIEYKTGVIDWK